MSSSSQNHTGAPHTPYYTLTWNPLAFEPPPSLNSSSFILSRDSSFSSLSSTPGSPSPNPPTGGPAARPSSQAPLCSPASIEVTRKRNRTSLPQGTARDRELHALWQLSDAELAQKDDSLILETIEHRLRSTCYDHYLKTVERRMVAGSVVLCLKLECKYGDRIHQPHLRERLKLKDGTTNFVLSANRCNTRRGKGPQPATNIPPYSEPRHRVLVALRCARRKRSFLSVEDPEYLDELKLVSQNALIKRPSQTTVRDDVERLYEGLAPYLAAYFQQRQRRLHVLLDGWTSPIHTSNIGIVLVWEDGGKIYHCLLELVKLTERHTGAYLAQRVAETLSRYHIDQWLFLINEDNASNCDTTATNLALHIPHFGGLAARLRCFLHCVQLSADILLSFFNKQYKRKRGAAATPTPMAAASTTPHDPVEHELQEILGGIETEMEAISRLIIDSGRVEHDETAVTGIREQAIREMSRRGVTYTPAQAASAIRVLPKHAALAVKTRDNGHVRDTFERLVLQYPADRRYGEYRTLSPRNATRWGSDYKLLQSYHALQTAVDKLLSLPLGLGNLRLSAEEANLTKNLRDMLAPVEEVTKAFQTDDVPLIMDVIPAYDQLQRDFCAMSNDTSLPSICRVAAHAAYLMTRKYYSRLDECEAYFFAIVLCPDRKLQWFYNHGWTQSDVAQILNMIKRRFLEKFKTSPSGSSESAPAVMERTPSSHANTASAGSSTTEGVHRWRQSAVASAPSEATTYDLDSITHYLSLPPHPLPPGTTVLQYWNSQLDITPCLATMALAYTSAPASTAPAEREFSEGRTMINWNQEGMSSQTFRAKMCVSAWSGAPWYNEEVAVQIITDTSRSLRTAPAS